MVANRAQPMTPDPAPVYPLVDLFAGPGGLCEGFASHRRGDGRRVFKPVLSIEKDPWAHGTLRLRALFRHLSDRSKTAPYYEYVRGAIQMNELLAACPEEAALADQEAWLAELGPPNHNEVAARVREVIAGEPRWVLIGGPPCQAYSLVGRSRMRGVDPARFEADHRHLLYREYLKLLAEHAPTAFVMENVKGLLSATHASKPIFRRILDDLVSPGLALGMDHTMHQYQLVAISPDGPDDQMGAMRPQDFILRSEDFGVPQARHRVIIVGFRRDLLHEGFTVARLQKRSPVPIEDVLSDAPRLRSGVSPADSFEAWSAALSEGEKLIAIEAGDVAAALRFTEKLARPPGRGGQFVAGSPAPQYRVDWYADPLIGGFLNHESRSHMTTDLHRYLFLSAHALLTGRSPTLKDFPEKLLPDHANVDRALKRGLFNDRFRVQRYGRPSSTITSHMSKDGHHFIHPDPSQCRSLTVREAARLQTFPDNYFFEGPRTSQYVQVGNAVPPLLSLQIAETLGRALDTLG